MLARLRRRTIDALLVVWLVATTVFALVRLAPGDPLAATLSDPRVSAEVRARWRTQWALDGSPTTQYVRYLGGLARGDLGLSLSRQRPVVDVLREALPYTLLLMGTGVALGVLLGVAAGTWQALRADSPGDVVVGVMTSLAGAVPEVWVALLLLTLFAAEWPLFPLAGHCAAATCGTLTGLARARELLHHLALPALTLAILTAPPIARIHRGALQRALGDPSLRAARARGASRRRVLLRHAAPSALRPVLTIVGLSLPVLVGGAVFVERVFGWPGLGLVMVDAVAMRDAALVTAVAIVGSLAVVVGGIVADLGAVWLDPRLRDRPVPGP
jgi:peptide/nickel transport system permease protein